MKKTELLQVRMTPEMKAQLEYIEKNHGIKMADQFRIAWLKWAKENYPDIFKS